MIDTVILVQQSNEPDVTKAGQQIQEIGKGLLDQKSKQIGVPLHLTTDRNNMTSQQIQAHKLLQSKSRGALIQNNTIGNIKQEDKTSETSFGTVNLKLAKK